ncbi:MAG: SDR family oxidoreductase [Isosphaeraceae bacterium]
MSNQVFLITGGSGGIGACLARILAERGDSAILFGRREDPLRALSAELAGKAWPVPGDATVLADLERAVQAGIDRFGRLDGLAHCVGSIFLKPLHLTSLEEFNEAIRLNLTSAFLASKATLAHLRPAGSGSVVLTSTVAVRQGLNNHESIAAAKGGIEGLVRSAAMTYARGGIRFNAVAPALIETPLAAPLLRTEASRAFSAGMHPLGRIGQPEEVARTIAFLLGSDSGWITGQVWGVDGGLGAGLAPSRGSS